MNTVTITGTVPEWTISDRLRKAREQTGLNQEDFAKDLGVSRGTVKNYECGSNTYKRPVLLAWAMRAGVPLEWLRSGQQEAPPEGPSTRSSRPTREYDARRALLSLVTSRPHGIVAAPCAA